MRGYYLTPRWQPDDGGRKAAGYEGSCGDCVTRAIAIGTGLSYKAVYDLVNAYGKREAHKQGGQRSNARIGVHKHTTRQILHDMGWVWKATMGIGTGCRVHLCEGELPKGRLIIQVSKHVTTMIDGVIHDAYDPSRRGTRCVYGYWQAK